jgi:hypothetical protein
MISTENPTKQIKVEYNQPDTGGNSTGDAADDSG